MANRCYEFDKKDFVFFVWGNSCHLSTSWRLPSDFRSRLSKPEGRVQRPISGMMWQPRQARRSNNGNNSKTKTRVTSFDLALLRAFSWSLGSCWHLFLATCGVGQKTGLLRAETAVFTRLQWVNGETWVVMKARYIYVCIRWKKKRTIEFLWELPVFLVHFQGV